MAASLGDWLVPRANLDSLRDQGDLASQNALPPTAKVRHSSHQQAKHRDVNTLSEFG
ncbi:Uncharacterised protein [Vibrio cholerae]|nr:Uncharacterised protein [Vibrio cholerae]